jgi:hypothetical protein
VAGIVYDKEVVWPGIVEKGSHPDAELDAWVRNGGDGPFVDVVVVTLMEHLL